MHGRADKERQQEVDLDIALLLIEQDSSEKLSRVPDTSFVAHWGWLTLFQKMKVIFYDAGTYNNQLFMINSRALKRRSYTAHTEKRQRKGNVHCKPKRACTADKVQSTNPPALCLEVDINILQSQIPQQFP